MIWYLLAKVDPVGNSFLGVSQVSVREPKAFSGEERLVPHLPQIRVPSGLENWHFGHWMGKLTPLYVYIVQRKDSNLPNGCQYIQGCLTFIPSIISLNLSDSLVVNILIIPLRYCMRNRRDQKDAGSEKALLPNLLPILDLRNLRIPFKRPLGN